VRIEASKGMERGCCDGRMRRLKFQVDDSWVEPPEKAVLDVTACALEPPMAGRVNACQVTKYAPGCRKGAPDRRPTVALRSVP